MSLLRLFKELDFKLVSVCFIVAGVCMMIALAVYTDLMSNSLLKVFDQWGWGWSYILGWLGCLLSFVVAGLAFFLK